MVYIHSAGAPAKNTKECVVGHMSCDATQGCTLETTFSVGDLDESCGSLFSYIVVGGVGECEELSPEGRLG